MTVEWGARPSNGTEGAIMMGQLCDHCSVDCDFHRSNGEKGQGCTILALSLAGERPQELGHDFETGRWLCTSYEGPCRCHRRDGDDPPKPPKPIPGQGLLFDVEPHPLLYTDTAEREAVPA